MPLWQCIQQLSILSWMTSAYIMACILYMYQDEPLCVLEVGLMPLFIFQDFRIFLEVPVLPRPPSTEEPPIIYRCFITRWSRDDVLALFDLRSARRFFHMLAFTTRRLFSWCFLMWCEAILLRGPCFVFLSFARRTCFSHSSLGKPPYLLYSARQIPTQPSSLYSNLHIASR